MTDREVMQQALEALEAVSIDVICRATHHKKKDQHGGLDTCPNTTRHITAIYALRTALKQQTEPVAMRMPKVGDKVICLEDESLGEVVSLTAGGSPDISFDDGSRGTYMLGEFAKLFGYVNPTQRKPLAASEILNMMPNTIPAEYDGELMEFARAVEAKLKENT